MTDSNWRWLKVTDGDWQWLTVTDGDLKLLTVTDSYLRWLKVTDIDWQWLMVTDSDWQDLQGLTVVNCEREWTSLLIKAKITSNKLQSVEAVSNYEIATDHITSRM